MQVIGGGALGPQAANAVRHVAAQNGVWSLGNFGGVPPKSAMAPYQGAKEVLPDDATSQVTEADSPISASVQEHDYRFVFNSSPVGMVRDLLLMHHVVLLIESVSNVCFPRLLGHCFDGRSIHRLQLSLLPAVELHQTRGMLDDDL